MNCKSLGIPSANELVGALAPEAAKQPAAVLKGRILVVVVNATLDLRAAKLPCRPYL
jgi:hypothetical protein